MQLIHFLSQFTQAAVTSGPLAGTIAKGMGRTHTEHLMLQDCPANDGGLFWSFIASR